MTELARIGLQNERLVLSSELLEQLQDTESRNPMLGLYGLSVVLATVMEKRWERAYEKALTQS